MRVLAFIVVTALFAGCASAPKAKYDLVMKQPSVSVALKASSVSVHMAKHLRAYTASPLIYNADGTVEPYRALTYYAPIDILAEKALNNHSTFRFADGTPPLRIEIADFAILSGEMEQTLLVRLATSVTKPASHFSAEATIPLEASPALVAETFSELLWRAYHLLATSAAETKEP